MAPRNRAVMICSPLFCGFQRQLRGWGLVSLVHGEVPSPNTPSQVSRTVQYMYTCDNSSSSSRVGVLPLTARRRMGLEPLAVPYVRTPVNIRGLAIPSNDVHARFSISLTALTASSGSKTTTYHIQYNNTAATRSTMVSASCFYQIPAALYIPPFLCPDDRVSW